MWQWLGSIFGWGAVNIGGNIITWIRDLIHGIWGWLSALFGNIRDAWHEFWQAIKALYRSASNLDLVNYLTFWHILFRSIPEVISWAQRQLRSLTAFADRIWRDLVQAVASLIARIERAVADLTAWVVSHVWTPLYKFFLAAWHWITHEGTLVYYYITHPDKLVLLIAGSLISWLEQNAWNLGALLGKFFLSLITRNLKRFALLIEDIILAVF